MSIRDFGKSVFIYLVVGSAGSLLVMLFAKVIEENMILVNSLLATIGRHTVGILSFHLIIFAIVAFVAEKTNISGGIIEKISQIIVSVVILVPTDWFIQKFFSFVYGIKRRNK
jgi:hypothetical protein